MAAKEFNVKISDHGRDDLDTLIIDFPPEIALEIAESLINQYRAPDRSRIYFIANGEVEQTPES